MQISTIEFFLQNLFKAINIDLNAEYFLQFGIQRPKFKLDLEVFLYFFQRGKFVFHNIYLSLRKISVLKFNKNNKLKLV